MNASHASPDARLIARKTAALRRSLRAGVAVRGAGRWLWMLLGILAASMVLDRWFRFDLAQRAILLAAIVGGAVWLLWRVVVRPVTRPVTDDALLLEVERRNPGLGQAVVTAFQLDREARAGRPTGSPALAGAVIADGVERARTVDFGTILDRPGLRWHRGLLAAGLTGAALLAVGTTRDGFLRTWMRRNLMLTGDQWPRATILELAGVSDGEIIVPRGIDHRQLAIVLPESRIREVAVDLEIESGAGRTIQRMKPTGRNEGREHLFVFPSIAEECRVRARGGDAVTEWARIVLVEPPHPAVLELRQLLPEWTGREPRLLEGAGPWPLVAGSGLEIRLRPNKPLRSATLESGDRTIPLAMAAAGTGESMDADESELGWWSARVAPAGGHSSTAGASSAETGIAGGVYFVRLVDDRGLGNVRETALEFRLKDNEPPSVRASLLGMSGLAVPIARVPVLWSASDDFGIASLSFETRWTEEGGTGGARSLPLEGFTGGPVFDRVPEQVSVLPLEPLGLQPGMTLRFQLNGTDHARPEPGTGHSREFILRIVTGEELLSDLLRREIEQRNVFQQAYDRQQELNARFREILAQWKASPGDPPARREAETQLIAAGRVQRSIGTSCAAVAGRFEEFLVEVANNRLDEQAGTAEGERSIKNRFQNEIIDPVRVLDEVLISGASRGIDDCRRLPEDRGQLDELAAATSATQEQVLEAMRAVLAAMQSSENYQEAVNRLLEIRRIEQNMRRELERGTRPPPDIFDPPAPGGNIRSGT